MIQNDQFLIASASDNVCSPKSKMASNHLQQVHGLQTRKLDTYFDLRTDNRFHSRRYLKRDFDLSPDHARIIEDAFDKMVQYSQAVNMGGGHRILIHVKDALISAAAERKRLYLRSRSTRVYDKIKTVNQLHRHSPLKHVCATQVGIYQMIGSELEAMALVIFMEEKSPSGVPLEHKIDFQKIDIYGLFTLTEDVERALNYARVMIDS